MKRKAIAIFQFIVRYKYIATLLGFGIWMFLFDRQNWFYSQKLNAESRSLESDTLFYSNEIKSATEKLEELKGDKKAIEKFARETYLMKRDDEDVFVIVNSAVKENKDTKEQTAPSNN